MIYHYVNDFNQLWKMLQSDAAAPESPVTIDCDSRDAFLPIDKRVTPVNSHLWLTPVQWAVCARIKWDDVKVKLEFTGTPWHPAEIPFVDLILSMHSSARSWLTLPQDDGSVTARPGVPQLSGARLKHLLRAELSSEDNRTDRHAINNLIVPLILNGELPNPARGEAPNHKYALGVMLQALGLMAAAPPFTKDVGIPIEGGYKAILVDDQAQHGWEQWVRRMLGRDVAVESIDPRSFWENLTTCLNEPQANAAASYGRATILLDLRLGGQLEAEVAAHFIEHANKWLSLGQLLGSEVEKALSDDLKALRSLSRRSESEEAIANAANPIRLTLLSRLVAVALPRVPVVLFSSTEDAHILKRLEIFGNVISTFTKGTVAHASRPEFLRERKRALHHAMRQSARMSVIARLAQQCEEAREHAVAARDEERAQAAHVELYIDESGDPMQGDPEMKLGGVIALFLDKNCHEAIQRAERFNRLCLEQFFCPFTWGSTLSPRNMGAAFPQASRDALRHFDAPKLSRVELSTKGPSNSFLGRLRGDRQHRDMMIALINLFAAAVLPEIEAAFNVEQLSVSIYAGSRVYPARDLPNGSALPYQMGFGYTGTPARPGLLYVLGDEDVGMIAFEAFQRFRVRLIRDVLPQQLLAVGLAYDAGVDSRHDPRPVRNSVNHVLRQRAREIPGDLWPSQYRESRQLEYPDWQPDCRALHYVADLCLTDATLVPIRSWSFRNDFDMLPLNRLLEAAERLRSGQGIPQVTELAEALLLLAKADIQHRQGVPRLLAADLCRLAGDSWERVLAGAFRQTAKLAYA